MDCNNVCRLCDRLILSQAVTFAGGTLTINIPAGSYNNGAKYCIVVAQAIPAATTINAPVVVTIGWAQVTACAVRTRTKYATIVSTNPTGGSFKLLGRPACAPNNDLRAIDGGAEAAEAAAGGGTT